LAAQADLARVHAEERAATLRRDAASMELEAIEQSSRMVSLNATAEVAALERAQAELRLRQAELQRERLGLTRAEQDKAAHEAAERAAVAARETALAQQEAERATEQLRADLQRNLTRESALESDRLARERMVEKLRLEAQSQGEMEERRIEAESRIALAKAAAQTKAEEARRETEVLLAKQRAEADVETARIRAEVDAAARIKQERENEDVRARELKASADLERERWVSAINVASDRAADALQALLGPYLGHVLLALGLGSLAIFGAREGLAYAGKLAAMQLGKPKLVRETSVGSWSLSGWLWGGEERGEAELKAAFDGVVLDSELMESVLGLARATRNAKRNHAPLRHAMFYGPPGTGKTLVAQRMARSVGLDYAIMSGGDVAPLGPDAVTEIHRLFEWAKASRKGLLLFVDEAEAFLGSRDRGGGVSENLRNVLSALLYQTGEQSEHYMLVLCTNRPEDLDAAVTDRIDQSLRFPLPDSTLRGSMLWQYFDQHILARTDHSLLEPGLRERARAVPPSDAAAGWCCTRRAPPKIVIHKDVSTSVIEGLAADSTGFSGRQIAKLMLNVQGAVYASEDITLRKDMIKVVVELEKKKHQNKSRAEAAARKEAEASGRHTAFLGSWD
jgi:ATPase family AAA domain-containing protein 3A/B